MIPRYDEAGYLYEYAELCDCPARESAVEEVKVSRELAIGMKRKRYLAECGIPARFLATDLERHPAGKRLAEAPRDASFYLWGPAGRGKTSLACAYLRRWIEKRVRRGRFTSAPALMEDLRSAYDDDQELDALLYWSRLPLLVIDDLGAEAGGKDWLQDRLYQIIGERHAQLTPLVVTSNLSTSALAERIGERVVWRLIELCGPENIIKVDGPNLRMARPQDHTKVSGALAPAAIGPQMTAASGVSAPEAARDKVG